MLALRVLAKLLRREVCVTVLAWLWLIGAATAQMWGGKKVEDVPTPAAEPAPVPAEDLKLFHAGLPVTVTEIPAGLANITAQGCNVTGRFTMGGHRPLMCRPVRTPFSRSPSNEPGRAQHVSSVIAH